MLHAQDRQHPSHQGVRHQLATSDNDPGDHLTTSRTPQTSLFPHDDVLCTRNKFYAAPDVDKHADSDNETVRDLNATECRDDGLKPRSIGKVRVQKCEEKVRHPVMVGAKLIGFTGNFTLRLYKAPVA